MSRWASTGSAACAGVASGLNPCGRIGQEKRIASARRWQEAAARTRSMVSRVSSIVAAGSTNTSACRAATLIAVPESPAKANRHMAVAERFGARQRAAASRWKRPS